MTKDKQIEEMAEEIREVIEARELITDRYGNAYGYRCVGVSDPKQIAEHLIENKGYRKASEVASEIFEEIEKSIANLEYRANTPRKTVKVEELKAQCDWILHEVLPKTLAELKKKYTEGEG